MGVLAFMGGEGGEQEGGKEGGGWIVLPQHPKEEKS